jgi:cytochrome c peroxidase
VRRRRGGRRATALALAAAALAALGCGQTSAPPEHPVVPPDTLHLAIPRGFPLLQVPPDNPTTVQGVALGRRLFYDSILSGDDTQSCASCHAQQFGFSDHGLRFSVGIDGVAGRRNAQALMNVGWNRGSFWDGRAATLEDQALEPVPNPIEMHQDWDEAEAEVRARPEYAELFRAAFGTPEVTRRRIVQAIAQFERTLISADSRYDRFLRSGQGLSASELRGYVLFFTERGDCFHCHVDHTFTDQAFHNNGLDSVFVDQGRAEITGRPQDVGMFKTPTLRNVEFTAPYMHDGRFATLEEVVRHYNSGGVGSPNVDPFIRVGRGLGLSAQDEQDLVAFLKALSDSSFIANPAFASPF